ncbi:MAG: FliO/MopB family protein [bacterium]
MRNHQRFILLFIIFLASITLNVINGFSAQEQPKYERSQPSPSLTSKPRFEVNTNPFSLFMKAIAIITVFSLFLYFFLRAYKHVIYTKGSGNHSPKIKILGSSVIGPKKSLCMVEVLDHLLILGVTEGQITVLLDTPLENLNDNLKNSIFHEKSSSNPHFAKLLKSWIQK